MSEHMLGNPKAPLILVEYADFECPYCGMAYPYVKRVCEQFADTLALVFREFPLVKMHPHAAHAAQAAEAAGLQGKFWEMHDLLFENQQHLEDASLTRYAKQLGLDLDRFKRDFGGPDVRGAIEQNLREGNDDGVPGTPAFFLNGELLELERYDDLASIVEDAAATVR